MIQLPTDLVANVPFVNLPDRPMLARVADSVYWMSRYIERAENVARLLRVNTQLLLDVGDLDPVLQRRQWVGLLKVLHQEPPPGDEPLAARVIRSLTFDRSNGNSLLSLVTRARENARAVRENISAEMYSCLNELYWSFQGDDEARSFEENYDALYDRVIDSCLLFSGLVVETLPHDQRYYFAQIAKCFERVDVTCRVVSTRFEITSGGPGLTDAPLRNVYWMSALRMCCSSEAYKRHHLNDLDPLRIASFLLLERNFPRSVRFCVSRARDALTSIRRQVTPRRFDDAERILGRLEAELEYVRVSDIIDTGLPVYMGNITQAISQASTELQRAYFPR